MSKRFDDLHKNLLKKSFSRLMIVDFNGAERLHIDPTTLRLKESDTMNKSLISVSRLVRTLASAKVCDVFV